MKSTKNTTGKDILVCDLKRESPAIKSGVKKAINRVLKKGWYVLGKELESFEMEFANFSGSSCAVGVASGTEALRLALVALSIGKNHEVITVANTAIPTAMAIVASGARPRFVDVKEDTFNLDTNKLEAAVNKNTRAIIPVHLYGNPCDMESVLKIARRHKLFVIEDACQAHGALYRGTKVGTLGDIGTFSFYPTKNLGCCGDGGMLVTDNKKIADKIKLLRNYGQDTRYSCVVTSTNSRLDEMQAAILRVKLRHLEQLNRRRMEIGNLYKKYLSDIDGIIPPSHKKDVKHVFHLYVIRCKNRDKLRKYLFTKGIETQIHYPIPLHLQKAFRYLGYKRGDFKTTESIAGEILSLPLFPELKDKEIKEICDIIRSFYQRKHENRR